MADTDFDAFDVGRDGVDQTRAPGGHHGSRQAGYDPDQHHGYAGQVASLVNWAGAIVSLALVAGLGVWGYQLLMRDVTGVPVVRALEGPLRVAPEEPGGAQAPHQGLSVNQVAAESAPAAPVQQVTLAPAPVRLAPEDQPMEALLPDTAEASEAPPPRQLSPIEAAIAEALGADAPTLLVAASVPADGLPRSPRPQARPLRTAATPVLPDTTILDLDPAQIVEGTRLVQLGAYPTAAEAQTEWDDVAARFADYLDDKQRVVQPVSSGGQQIYRLRVAGFSDLDDARRFCSVLVAGDAGCIPVLHR